MKTNLFIVVNYSYVRVHLDWLWIRVHYFVLWNTNEPNIPFYIFRFYNPNIRNTPSTCVQNIEFESMIYNNKIHNIKSILYKLLSLFLNLLRHKTFLTCFSITWTSLWTTLTSFTFSTNSNSNVKCLIHANA